MDSLQRFRSCRTPQSRKSPKHLPSPQALLQVCSPHHKRSSPSLYRFLAAVPPVPSLVSRKKSPRKCGKRRFGSRLQHHYSTSISTAADSAVLDPGKCDKTDEMNAILTPTSHRLVQEEKGLSLIEEDLRAYSSTQVAGKLPKLDYVQCETLTLPFYNVTPSRIMPKTQKHALARVCDERDFTPDRSQSPPLDRILHQKYLQTTPKDTIMPSEKPRRLPKQRGISLIDHINPVFPLPERSFRRRLKREKSEKPTIYLPRMGQCD